ncbi:hypothetical protein PR003_g32169, partial [Phytophthora rubi]|jgi:glutamine synthetase
MTSAL